MEAMSMTADTQIFLRVVIWFIPVFALVAL